MAVVSALALASSPVAAQQPSAPAGLKIVVVAGEDAVNIIQQKTAVAPIVEVRDRNNLPVSGVAVTFSIGGQGASFGGASTLTVVTNAAGQATAAGLTPTATGAIQISATATFQGQTAIATIAQSNVLTAAEAATAGAGAGGSGAGGGGGMSGTMIGVIGGAVAAGGLVVAKAAGGGSESSPSTPSPTSSSTPPTTPPPTNPTPSSATLTGPMNGPYVETSTGGGASCTITYNRTGTVRVVVQRQGGAVTGTGTAEGTQTMTSQNCGVVPPGLNTTGPFVFTGPISGTESSFRFTQELRGSGPVSSGISFAWTETATFTGTLSGATGSGTLAVNGQTDVTGPGGTSRSTRTGSFPVTLR